jgi:hypothetical protein
VSVLTFPPIVIIYVSFGDTELMSINSMLCPWIININLVMLSGILSGYVAVKFYAEHFLSYSHFIIRCIICVPVQRPIKTAQLCTGIISDIMRVRTQNHRSSGSTLEECDSSMQMQFCIQDICRTIQIKH